MIPPASAARSLAALQGATLPRNHKKYHMRKYLVHFTTKMGASARVSETVLAATPKEAASYALARLSNPDVYTVSVDCPSDREVFHFGHTGVFIEATC